MSNGGRNPGGRIENRVKRYLFRFEQSTTAKNKRHCLRMIEKCCWHARKQLRAISEVEE